LDQSRALYDRQRCGSLAFSLGADPGVLCHAQGAWTVWMLGDEDQAMALSRQALTLAQELKHPPSLAYAWFIATVLQITPGASPEEIHAAYTQQLLKYHPDRVAHLGEEFQRLAHRKTQAINHAYALLKQQGSQGLGDAQD
jgi:hypothetical protein